MIIGLNEVEQKRKELMKDNEVNTEFTNWSIISLELKTIAAKKNQT